MKAAADVQTLEEMTAGLRAEQAAAVANALAAAMALKSDPLTAYGAALAKRRTDYINDAVRYSSGPLPYAFGKPEGTVPFDELRRIAAGGCYITTALHARRAAGLRVAAARWSGARHDPGWRVVHTRESEPHFDTKKVRNYERRKAACEALFRNPHPHDGSFSGLLTKIGADLRTIDRACLNVIWNAAGTAPVQIAAVDGATIWPIRLWAEKWVEANIPERQQFDAWDAAAEAFGHAGGDLSRYAWVQVDATNGYRPQAFLQSNEMIVGVANPSPVAAHWGYGFSPVEMAWWLENHHMLAENYQTQFYTHGIITTILLLVGTFGTEGTTELVNKLRSQHSGPNGAHIPPILPIGPNGNDLRPVSIRPPLADLGHEQSQHTRAALIAAIHNTDLTDINLDPRGPGASSLSERDRAKEIDLMRDEGVLGDLNWLAANVFTPVVQMIDPEFELRFTGLNDKAEELEVQLRTQRVGSFQTLNEGRLEEGKSPIEITMDLNGEKVRIADLPAPMAQALLQAAIQSSQQQQQAQMQQQQMEQQQQAQMQQQQEAQQHQASMADQDHARRMQASQQQQMDPDQGAQAAAAMQDDQGGMPEQLRWPEDGEAAKALPSRGAGAFSALLEWYP